MAADSATFAAAARKYTCIESQEAIMARALGRGLCVVGLFVVLSAASSRAGDVAAPRDVRAPIERQLEAFAHDDAAAAYALAAPAIKTVFSDPDHFIAMVRDRYPPVYRHRSVEFGRTDVDGDNVQQVVTFIDDDNVVWKALYTLARQPDGSWLINGCVLIKSTDTAT
jgi:hypothetical protein